MNPRDDEAANDTRSRRTRVVLIMVLVLLILLLAGLAFFVVRVASPIQGQDAASAERTGIEWIRSIYGFGPNADQQLIRPTDAAIGPDGRIWAADPQHARIVAFNPNGSFSTLIDLSRVMPPVQRIQGVGLDQDGNVYVADYGNERIAVFSEGGALLRQWQVPGPSEVAVRGNRVYVATVYGVAVFTPAGTLIGTWGKRGRGPEEFDVPSGLAFGEDGTVYVADTQNQRIKAYGPAGKLLWIWPESRSQSPKPGIAGTSSPDAAQLPTGIAVDGNGRLVVVDAFGFDLVVLQPGKQGATVVARYGEQGAKDGQFSYMTRIEYDPARDWFAVTDQFNSRVQILALEGTTSNTVAATVRRMLPTSWWQCTWPLALLIVALIAAIVLRRRARHRSEAVQQSVPEE